MFTHVSPSQVEAFPPARLPSYELSPLVSHRRLPEDRPEEAHRPPAARRSYGKLSSPTMTSCLTRHLIHELVQIHLFWISVSTGNYTIKKWTFIFHILGLLQEVISAITLHYVQREETYSLTADWHFLWIRMHSAQFCTKFPFVYYDMVLPFLDL